jgi:RNA polymerase sigma factor (sigma-70 family)
METQHILNTGVLIERCKKGDNAAFREIYDQYSRAMYNVAGRILNNNEEARDVLQESFISAFRHINQYSGTSTFGSWLKRIVINRSIDHLKKKNPRLVEWSDQDIPAEEDQNTEEDFVPDVDLIKCAMEMLPDGYRIILTLYLFEDYTHHMIAHKLGISEGTSKSQYARGRKKLADIIKRIGK